jgi:hypothetical protein
MMATMRLSNENFTSFWGRVCDFHGIFIVLLWDISMLHGGSVKNIVRSE